jgi:hypothetical protein
VAHNPALDASLPPPRGGGMPGAGLIVAVLGFALLMTVIAIVGAGWLRTGEGTTAAVQEPVVQEQPRPSKIDTEEAEDEEPEEIEEMVIELDSLPEQEKKARSGSTSKPSSTANGKQLTAAQRAMLERMGGTGADLSGLQQRDSDSAGSNKAKGDLTAAQLSQVVLRGKQNL